jgi:hypothetical protein
MRASSRGSSPNLGPGRQDAIVAQVPERLIPGPRERGLVSSDREHLAASVVASWAMFAAMVEPLDLDRVTRAKGLTAREVVIPLGAWPDNRPLDEVLSDARRGVVGDHDQGALVDAVRAAHAHESDRRIKDALTRQADDMESLLYGAHLEDVADLPVASMLGTLPLVSFVHASTYPLSTSALDLEQAGADVPQRLLDNGLLGLLDTIGALAARQGVTASLAAATPTTTIAMGAVEGAWRTVDLVRAGDDPATGIGPAVRGTTRMLLDVTAGRADVPNAVRRKELGVDDWQGLLALMPIVEQVPGIPGRAALVATAKAASVLSGAWRRLGRG